MIAHVMFSLNIMLDKPQHNNLRTFFCPADVPAGKSLAPNIPVVNKYLGLLYASGSPGNSLPEVSSNASWQVLRGAEQ